MSMIECSRCQMVWPAEKFPDVGDSTVCEHCLAGEDAEKAKQKLIAKTRALATKMMDVQEQEKLLPPLNTIVSQVYEEFGGPRAFAQRFHWMINELCERSVIPASAPALMLQFLKLHQAVETQNGQDDMRKLTDEQIRREQSMAMMQMVLDAANDPSKRAMLEEMLKGHGLSITKVDPEEEAKELVRRINEME